MSKNKLALVPLFNGIVIFVAYLMRKPSFYKYSSGTIEPIPRGG